MSWQLVADSETLQRRFRSARLQRAFARCIVTALLALGPLTPALGAGESPEKIDPAASCVSADCHASVADRPHLHWPEVAAPGQCQRCHVPKADRADRHDFETDKSAGACLGCHEPLAGKIRDAKHSHKAAEDD